jgi:hypothetical protein
LWPKKVDPHPVLEILWFYSDQSWLIWFFWGTRGGDFEMNAVISVPSQGQDRAVSAGVIELSLTGAS